MAEIMVVDDEIGIRELLSEILGEEGHSVLLADGAHQARRLRDENPLDLVLLDIWMPETDGLSLLKEWAADGKLTMPVIMMSGHATIDTAVEATRIGALDFLEKPVAYQKLLRAVEQGLARGRALFASKTAPKPPDAPAIAAAGAGAEIARDVPRSVDAPTERGPGIAHADLPLDQPLREAREAFERIYFEHHLLSEQGSMTRVAERTGLERTHLYRKLKQLGIDLSRIPVRRSRGV